MKISSTFLTSIQKQKDGLARSARAGGSTLTTFITSYISFLQANNQYTNTVNLLKYVTLNPIGPANGSDVYSNQSQIDQAMIDVVKSICELEGQEVAKIVQNNPNVQYEAASMLYQSAYNFSLIAQNLSETSFGTTKTTEGSDDFYTMQLAIEATKATHTFVKIFVTDYNIISQIDALYLQLSNLGDVNQQALFKLTSAQTALKNFLVGLNMCIDTMNQDSNSTNDASNNTSSNFTTLVVILLICGSIGAYFFFKKNNQNFSIILNNKK